MRSVLQCVTNIETIAPQDGSLTRLEQMQTKNNTCLTLRVEGDDDSELCTQSVLVLRRSVSRLPDSVSSMQVMCL